jgi:hypothetical protein
MEVVVDYDGDSRPYFEIGPIIEKYDTKAIAIGHERTRTTSFFVSENVKVGELEKDLNEAGFRVLRIAA